MNQTTLRTAAIAIVAVALARKVAAKVGLRGFL